jgi:hypothetical protein
MHLEQPNPEVVACFRLFLLEGEYSAVLTFSRHCQGTRRHLYHQSAHIGPNYLYVRTEPTGSQSRRQRRERLDIAGIVAYVTSWGLLSSRQRTEAAEWARCRVLPTLKCSEFAVKTGSSWSHRRIATLAACRPTTG